MIQALATIALYAAAIIAFLAVAVAIGTAAAAIMSAYRTNERPSITVAYRDERGRLRTAKQRRL